MFRDEARDFPSTIASPARTVTWRFDVKRKSPRFAGFLRRSGHRLEVIEWLAGAGGIEPPNGGIKIRCLTAWLRPIWLLSERRSQAYPPAPPVYRGSWAISTGQTPQFR